MYVLMLEGISPATHISQNETEIVVIRIFPESSTELILEDQVDWPKYITATPVIYYNNENGTICGSGMTDDVGQVSSGSQTALITLMIYTRTHIHIHTHTHTHAYIYILALVLFQIYSVTLVPPFRSDIVNCLPFIHNS